MSNEVMAAVDILILGGRRCGKTSIVAAMKDCFEKVNRSESPLDITVADDTVIEVAKKINEIKGYFPNVKDKRKRDFIPDDSPSKDIDTYNFEVCIKGKGDSCLNLRLTDYPGELINETEGFKEIKKYVVNSNIILVAIDTPFLMENTLNSKDDAIGCYNEDRNYCELIKNQIKNLKPKDDFPSLIMFVPLKCEKYYNNSTMHIVNKKIRAAYESIFNFAGGPNLSRYEIVISPILTFGPDTAEFSRFKEDENGNVIQPYEPVYIFTKRDCSYNPMFCEQPLFYSMAYLLSIAHNHKTNLPWYKKFKNKLLGFFKNNATEEDFLNNFNYIKSMLKKEGDGYEICQDPLGLSNK